ncbi:MAG: hypothetical protein IT428_05635 [Planctomycetaceae bacterium]|nr:hypothetical protein [Planctomycetaceae bacterium]
MTSEDVVPLWVMLCPPATLVTWMYSWAHLHGIANQWRVISIDRKTLVVRTPKTTRSIDLTGARWFDGYSFSDDQMRSLAPRKTIVVSFPPFGPTDRISIGWSEESVRALTRSLNASGATYCGSRSRYERLQHLLLSVCGATAFVLVVQCGIWLGRLIAVPIAIPAASWASTAVVGARLSYEVSRHLAGDHVTGEGSTKWILVWFFLAAESVLRLNVRLRDAPILLDRSRLASAVTVAALQVAAAVLVYIILKRRESQTAS